MSIHLQRLRSLLLALGLLAVLGLTLDFQQLVSRLSEAKWHWLLPGFVLMVGAQTLSALRWHGIARRLSLISDARMALRIYFQGITLNTVLPGAVVGGDIWRTMGLHQQGNRLTRSAFATLFDRISGVWMLAIMGLVALYPGAIHAPKAPENAWLQIYGAVLLGIVLTPIFPGAKALASRLHAHEKLKKLSEKLTALYEAQTLLFKTMGWSFAVQSLSMATLWACQASVGIELSISSTAALAAGLFIFAVIPASFGGFGSREAGAALLYSAIGVPSEAGVAASVMYGVISMLIGIGAAVLAPPKLTLVNG